MGSISSAGFSLRWWITEVLPRLIHKRCWMFVLKSKRHFSENPLLFLPPSLLFFLPSALTRSLPPLLPLPSVPLPLSLLFFLENGGLGMIHLPWSGCKAHMEVSTYFPPHWSPGHTQTPHRPWLLHLPPFIHAVPSLDLFPHPLSG
jgi:hypothetical protein